MGLTPAERLLAAADLLDKRASEATEGPWRYSLAEDTQANGLRFGIVEAGYIEGDWTVFTDAITAGYTTDPGDVGQQFDASQLGPANARYIATMHPEVGRKQAALLRLMGSVDYPEVRMGVSVYTQKLFEAMLDLADLVLAGEQEQVAPE